jgi:tetratricopeptide (TPR) repeat protein
MIMPDRRLALACCVATFLITEPAYAQDHIASARQLYASAQYDEALKVLDQLSRQGFSPNELQSIELYRTLCLIAVGRRADADRAIEAIITRDPLYRAGDELSPRTRSAFSDAKKRLLPGLVQQQYADAKSAFERNQFDVAEAAFTRVLEALNDPDIEAAAQQPPLADMRLLAAGFRDLSVKALAPPPAPLPPPASAPPEPAAKLPPRIFTGEEAGIRPPATIAQDLPNYPGVVPASGLKGVVEVVINEQGSVDSAVMVVPVQAGMAAMTAHVGSSYDKMVVAATSKWQFKPALFNGAPVKFRKRVQINVSPPAR